MLKNDFLNSIQNNPRVDLSDFATEKMIFFLQHLSDEKPEHTGLLEMISLKMLSLNKARIYDNDLFALLKTALKAQAQWHSKHFKIKNFKGTRYEEEILLTEHFLDKDLKRLGLLWLKDLKDKQGKDGHYA